MFGTHSSQFFNGATPALLGEQSKLIAEAHAHVRQMLNADTPWRDVLSLLARQGERLTGPGSTSSILVLDEAGLLRNGASPGLPPDYLKAIDGIKPDPQIGTCAAAAATGTLIVTLDFSADDKWAEFRHWPHSLGYVSAWSLPIKSEGDKVLGTFGTYYRRHHTPTPAELHGIEQLAAIAAHVLAAR